MTTCHLYRGASRVLIALALFSAGTHLQANTLMQDKGIYPVGPFPIPDITQPASASAEAVFLAGSYDRAPLFLNELLIDGQGSHGQFSDNGWVGGSAFNINVSDGGRTAWITWDLSGTPYALSFICVNFDNDFYHVYGTDPLAQSEGAVQVTGNLRDVISHIHFFGVSTVPDDGATAAILSVSLLALGLVQHRLSRLRAR